MKTRSEISASSINPTGSINAHESLIETARKNLEKDNLLTRYFPMERVNRDSRIHDRCVGQRISLYFCMQHGFLYIIHHSAKDYAIAVNQNIPYSWWYLYQYPSGKHQFVKDIWRDNCACLRDHDSYNDQLLPSVDCKQDSKAPTKRLYLLFNANQVKFFPICRVSNFKVCKYLHTKSLLISSAFSPME